MASQGRGSVLGARISWLCLLAAFFGGQLFFWQDSTDPFAPVEAFWFKITLSLGAIPFLAGRLTELKAFVRTATAKAALAWMAWLWVAALLAPAAFHADAFKTALEYSLYSLPFFVAVLATGAERRALGAAFLSGSLLAAVYGFFQHFNIDPWHWSTNFAGRPLGTIGNPNFFGGHLLLAWGLCLAGLLLAPPARRLRWAGALVLLLLVLFFTMTVGVWLGMAVSVAVLAAFALTAAGQAIAARWGLGRRQCWQAAAALALTIALLGASPWGRQRLANFGSSKSISVVNRLMMWKAASTLWRQAPIQGAGLAVYRPSYPKIQAQILEAEPDKGWNYVVTWLPHQNYLYLLCETGLIGLGLFLAYWGLCLYHGWRRAAQGEALALGALLAIAGLLGEGFLNTFSNIPPTAVAAALCLGFLATAPAVASRQKQRAALEAPAEAWVMAVVLAFMLGKAAGIELVANRLTRQAGRLEKRDDHAGAALLYKRAASFEVANFTQQALVGVHFQEAENLRQTGRLAEAIEAYRKDLDPNPWAPEVHNMLGASLGQYGAQTRNGSMVAEGADHLRTAAWLNPGYTTALINLGGSYMTLSNLTGAAQAWTEVLHYEPANKEALGYLHYLQTLKAKP
jgi:O-antigen ligase